MTRLIVFGALGDLMRRYLAPALLELDSASALPDGFEMLGVGRQELTDDEFRSRIDEALEDNTPASDEERRAELLGRFRYLAGDATSPDDVSRALGDERDEAVVYLALPPAVFGDAVAGLATAGFGGVLVVEKPFGHDLGSARELNAVIHDCLAEEQVFRIDHFLGMQTVQNILGLRFANRLFEPIWNCNHVEQVDIVWDETLTLEGRGFYDGVGAVRDVVQNHLLQMLCLIAMEAPADLDARDLRDRKVQLLREVRRHSRDEVAHHTIRGRYTSGEIGGEHVPAYVEEDEVEPSRGTETFAELRLYIDNWRWSGVPFVLRTAKALGRERKEIVVRFRSVPHGTFATAPERPNLLRISLEPETLSLGVNINTPGDAFDVHQVDLARDLSRDHLGAYAQVISAALAGDPTLSIRDDEVERAWAIVDPILEAWQDDLSPLREYPAGSTGPEGSHLAT